MVPSKAMTIELSSVGQWSRGFTINTPRTIKALTIGDNMMY